MGRAGRFPSWRNSPEAVDVRPQISDSSLNGGDAADDTEESR